MSRLRAATVGGVLLAGTLFMAHPAGAQTLDPQRCAKSAAQGGSGFGGSGQVGGGAGGGGGGSWGSAPSASSSTTTTKPDGEHGLCASLMGSMIPGTDPGQFPTANYDLGYDQGGALSVWRKVSGFLMDSTFLAARWAVRLGLWVVNWAMGFEFATRLAAPASDVAARYQSRVVGPMHLEPLFLSLTAAFGGWLALTGKMSRGIGEFATSVTLAALAGGLWAHPATYLTNSLHFTAGLSFEVAAVTMNDRDVPTSSDAIARPMLAAIHKAFVETPHEILDWGRAIPPGDRCRPVYEAAVASGPWGPADEPRDAMKAAGCNTEAAFNHDPSGDRIFGALVVLVAALLAIVLLGAVALTFIAAQLAIVVAIAVAPVALVLGTLPGRGRALFWRWVASIGMALAGVVMMAVLLSMTLMGISALLSATAGQALLVQLLVTDVVVVIALRKRSHLLSGGRRAVSGFVARMSGGTASLPRSHAGRSAVLGAAGGFAAARTGLRMVNGHQGGGGRALRAAAAGGGGGAPVDDGGGAGGDLLEQATVSNDYLLELIHIFDARDDTAA